MGSLSNKHKLSGLVVKKKTTLPTVTVASKSSETTGTSQFQTSKTSANQSKDTGVHSEINKSANQSGFNKDNSAGVNDSSNHIKEKTEKKGETALAGGDTDTKSEGVKSSLNSDNTSEGVDKTAVSKQTVSSSNNSGALGLLGAYSDSETDNSD